MACEPKPQDWSQVAPLQLAPEAWAENIKLLDLSGELYISTVAWEGGWPKVAKLP